MHHEYKEKSVEGWEEKKKGRRSNQISHINRVVESQNTVGFHYAVNTPRHSISPVGHAHWVRGHQFLLAGRLSCIVRCVCHQDKTQFLDGFDEGRDNVL